MGWLWYPGFIHGTASGPYWAMMVFSWSLFPLVALLLVLVPLVITGRAIWRSARKAPGQKILWHPLLVSIAAGILLFPGGFPIMVTPFRHADAKVVRGQRFHLAQIYALIDINYGLYQCDEWGLWCKLMSRSGDYSVSTGHIETDPQTGTVIVGVCEPDRPPWTCKLAHMRYSDR